MNKTKVLLVDDEPDFLEVMGARIRSWGYDLMLAHNARGAIATLKSAKPDIIILDYLMPGMDGVACLKAIRKIDKKIPVIMFTAYPDEKSFKGAEKLGIAAYVPKLSAHSQTQSALKTALAMLEKAKTK